MKDKDWALLPYFIKRINEKKLLTTRFGSWVFLDNTEIKGLKNLEAGSPLFKKLEESNIVASKNNIKSIMKDFRTLNSNLFSEPSLFIVCLTSGCNLSCRYCHASSPKKEKQDMNQETAVKVIEHIMNGQNHRITVEFQGGEPLSNWDGLKFFVERLKERNALEKKEITLALTTNLLLLDQEKLGFLIDNDVRICVSLDGPKEVHDKNRVALDGSGTYDKVVEKINIVKDECKKINKKGLLSAIPTITKNSLGFHKEIIDEYLKHGFNIIHLRFMGCLGLSKENWAEVGYTAEEFASLWNKGLDYILKLNLEGREVVERTALMMLIKIIAKKDPMYTELMSPCGAGRVQILFDETGRVYTCDEGRMVDNDLFKMGNLHENTYEEIMGSPVLMAVTQASMMDLYNPSSPFIAWMGTCPVENYSEQGNVVVKISESRRNRIYEKMFETIFEGIEEEKEKNEIFIKWVGTYLKENEKEVVPGNKKRVEKLC